MSAMDYEGFRRELLQRLSQTGGIDIDYKPHHALTCIMGQPYEAVATMLAIIADEDPGSPSDIVWQSLKRTVVAEAKAEEVSRTLDQVMSILSKRTRSGPSGTDSGSDRRRLSAARTAVDETGRA